MFITLEITGPNLYNRKPIRARLIKITANQAVVAGSNGQEDRYRTDYGHPVGRRSGRFSWGQDGLKIAEVDMSLVRDCAAAVKEMKAK